MNIYKNLLDKTFPYKDYSLEDLIDFIDDVNYFAKNKQILIGKLVLEAQKKDWFALNKISKQLGLKKRTLEAYRQKAKKHGTLQ
mgnify:CR=1 FL=1